MPDRVNVANVTCPASTPTTAPVEVPFTSFAPGIPRKVTIVIPDGHAGLTGIALGFGHQPVIPDDTGQFISGDGEVIPFELSSYPAGPTWSAFLCNDDLIAHSWQVRFEFDEIKMPDRSAIAQPIAPAAILAAGAIALGNP